jgi:hypothetical protein
MMVFMGGVPILFEGRGGGDLVARWNRQGSGQEIIRKAAREKPRKRGRNEFFPIVEG